MKKAVAFIPARAGSKGIPGKNKKDFRGKPLVMWSIDQAKKSKLFSKIIVSSDDPDIIELAKSAKVDYDERAERLAQDDTSLDVVLTEYFQNVKCDYVCLLQPTSPLRSVKDITESFKFIQMKKYWCVVGVTWNPIMGWVERPAKREGCWCLYQIEKRPNRQTRDDFFLENGAVYWVKRVPLLQFGNRIASPRNTKLYEMPLKRSLETDTPFDWYMAECAYDWGRK